MAANASFTYPKSGNHCKGGSNWLHGKPQAAPVLPTFRGSGALNLENEMKIRLTTEEINHIIKRREKAKSIAMYNQGVQDAVAICYSWAEQGAGGNMTDKEIAESPFTKLGNQIAGIQIT